MREVRSGEVGVRIRFIRFVIAAGSLRLPRYPAPRVTRARLTSRPRGFSLPGPQVAWNRLSRGGREACGGPADDGRQVSLFLQAAVTPPRRLRGQGGSNVAVCWVGSPAPQPWRLQRAGHYLGLGMAGLFCFDGARMIAIDRGDGLLVGIVFLVLGAAFLSRAVGAKRATG
jgi:hypothetical protein